MGVVVRVGRRARDREGIVVTAPWPEQSRRPASWLLAHAAMLPRRGRALDVACGRGRNAIWLAERGLTTLAVDRNEEAIRDLNEAARAMGLPLTAEVRDLESGPVSCPQSAYDAIVVVHYLHRPLFPALIDALAPGGVLVYETFTRAQATRGKPTNPDFLLKSGELLELVRPLEVLASREGDYEGRQIASVIARRSVS